MPIPARPLRRWPTWFQVALIFVFLYFFLVGIGALGDAFKLIGKGVARDLLETQGGPLASLFIGILATALVQSSSTTTSLVVVLVAGQMIPLESGVFMVMGANVGTTVTNTIVSLGHITRAREYQRAFAAATVHDFFNVIVLLILFPLELYTGFLTVLAEGCLSMFSGIGGMNLVDPIQAATNPTRELLKSLVQSNGIALVVVAIIMTFGMLIMMVKTLKSVMLTRLESLFDRVLFKTPRRSLTFGFIVTILVQSSSIATSVAVPLVGAGLITIKQVFPYTMGANIGTTMTALIAALGAGEEVGLLVAFHHVLFNVVGVAIVWFFRDVPVFIATKFAQLALYNRLIPIVYIVVTFYLLPLVVIWLAS